MLSGTTRIASAIVGTAVFRIVVSIDSIRNATATSQGSRRLTEGSTGSGGGGTAGVCPPSVSRGRGGSEAGRAQPLIQPRAASRFSDSPALSFALYLVSTTAGVPDTLESSRSQMAAPKTLSALSLNPHTSVAGKRNPRPAPSPSRGFDEICIISLMLRLLQLHDAFSSPMSPSE